MHKPLTLEEVIQADHPAYTEHLLYRFEPRQGFFRSCTARFAPAWLAADVPEDPDLVWLHLADCDCQSCVRPPASLAVQGDMTLAA